jgi:hypothetical protein
MSFLKRHQTSVAVVAALALFAGAAYVCQGPGCGSNCPLSGLFSPTTAYAGPGCSAKATCPKASAACDAASKASAQTAATATDGKTSCKHPDGKTCGDKETCITKCMADKGMTRAEAEACWQKCQAGKSEGKCSHTASTAEAIEIAPVPFMVSTAAVTTETAGKTCSKTCGNKEACVAKCMAEKGMTRAEAEACWQRCQTDKAEGKCSRMIQTAAAIETTPVPSREACVDALVAKGMTREAAEAHVAKCEKEGMTAEAAVQQTAGGHACPGAASSAKPGCCAKRAAATTATTEPAPGGSR